MTHIPFEDRIPCIRSELVKYAQFKETTSYTRLSSIAKMPLRSFWRGVLDQISRQETGAGRPDITHLVISKKTGMTSRLEFTDAHKPSDEQRRRHRELLEEIYAYYETRH